MATGTDVGLRQLVVYEVFVRNHTPEGTFGALVGDLDRIRGLGVDVVWLMPIHPIGEASRKGSLGSPYANRDYRTVNPELGCEDDFRLLVDAIHERGMLCMIDVVYNHTSPDSTLVREHPEFFFRREDGSMGNHVGDWSDIVDLDYDVPGLWDYQIQTLCQWARIVDGFRCDVASLVPVEFWIRARRAVEEVHPGFMWLAETVHRSFGSQLRASGMRCARDTEVFEAFDMEYDYDTREAFERMLRRETSLSAYLDLLDFQESVYPDNYDKLRFLENHDTPRIAELAEGARALENLTALSFFLKGTTLLYAGQEIGATHAPGLFDRDTIAWGDAGTDLSGLMARMARIKREVLGARDFVRFSADDGRGIAAVTRDGGGSRKVGVFSVYGESGTVGVDLADGEYRNLVDDGTALVREGRVCVSGTPIVIAEAEGHA